VKREAYRPDVEAPSIESAARSIELFPPKAEEKPEAALMSRSTTASGVDEVADNHTLTRMLQDPTGRLRQLPFSVLIFICSVNLCSILHGIINPCP